MRRHAGWSLVELLIVLAALVLLAGIMVPSLPGTRQRARLVTCAKNLQGLSSALAAYASIYGNCMPPFAFSDHAGDLPVSAHWGGASQAADPAAFGRKGVGCVNLWALVQDKSVSQAALLCPGSSPELREGLESYFSYTSQQSTYAMRFPYSADLFNFSASLANYGGKGLLDIYARSAGGQVVPVGQYRQVVPLVRTDVTYRIAAAAACGDGNFDPADDAILADTFWRADFSASAAAAAPLKAAPVRWSLCHEDRFNVLQGNGAVKTIVDDGTVASNSHSGLAAPATDGVYNATYAERVWQFFDGQLKGR